MVSWSLLWILYYGGLEFLVITIVSIVVPTIYLGSYKVPPKIERSTESIGTVHRQFLLASDAPVVSRQAARALPLLQNKKLGVGWYVLQACSVPLVFGFPRRETSRRISERISFPRRLVPRWCTP